MGRFNNWGVTPLALFVSILSMLCSLASLFFGQVVKAQTLSNILAILAIAALALSVGITSMKSRILSGRRYDLDRGQSGRVYVKKQLGLFIVPLITVAVVIVSLYYSGVT